MTLLRKAKAHVKLLGSLDYREYLRELYIFVKGESVRYSWLRFAGDLGFSETNVIRLVAQGKRKLAPASARTIAEALSLTGNEKRYFLTLVKHNDSRRPDQREILFKELLTLRQSSLSKELDKAQLEYFSEWYHPVLRELVALPDFSPDPEWINGRLYQPLLPRQIMKSLELLERIGYISYCNETKKYRQAVEDILTPQEVLGINLVRYHQQVLELAKEAVTRVEPSLREYAALTLRVSPEVALKMKSEIHAFAMRLLELEKESEGASEVYQVGVQLFPYTKRKE